MSARVSDQRGSVLLLMPAAVLVLVVMAAIAVDAAVVFLAQRELADAAAAAANDAAVAALQAEGFYTCGELRIDAATAQAVAAASFAARRADYLTPVGGGVSVAVDAAPDGRLVEVTVAAAATVELIFAPALPGAPHTRTVQAAARGTAEQDPAFATTPEGCR